jgi:cell division protein FtsW (lipid II flippase)
MSTAGSDVRVTAAGYAIAIMVILLAARQSLADHLGAPRVDLLTALAVASAAGLVTAVAGTACRAAAHLFGALAVLGAIGISLAYRFSVDDGRHQVITVSLASAAFVTVTLTGRRCHGWLWLRRFRRTLGVAGCLLVASPMVPGLGQASGGARLLVHVPGLTLEPGLLGAILVTVSLASSLAADGDLLAIGGSDALRNVPVALAGSVAGSALALCLTVLSHDLGGAIVLSLALIVCLAVGTHRVRYPVTIATALACGIVISWQHLGYVSVRIENWVHPLAPTPDGGTTQVAAARYALAWGGVLGHGLGSGTVSGPAALPVASSDYAIVQLASETGVLPALGVLAALTIVVIAAWTLVGRARAGDDQFVSIGAAVLLMVPSLLLVAGVSGLLPLTGTPVPLFEMGESAAVAAAIAAGLLAGGARHDLSTGSLAPAGGYRRLRVFPAVAIVASVLVLVLAASMLFSEASDTRLTRTLASPYLLASAPVLRGRILTADGTVLAYSTGTGSLGTAARHYPATSMDGVDITGVAVPRAATTGLEASEDPQLRCGAAATVPESLDNPVLPAGMNPAQCIPADIITTIATPVQRAAAGALRGLHGVAVVLDADTGAVLGMAANPAAASPNTVVAPNVGADLSRLAALPATLWGPVRSPLFNPATSLDEPLGGLGRLLAKLRLGTGSMSVSGVPVSAGVVGVTADLSSTPHELLTPLGAANLGADIVTGRRVVPYLTAAVCRDARPLGTHTISRGAVIPGAANAPADMASVSPASGPGNSLLTEARPTFGDVVGVAEATVPAADGGEITWLLAAVRYGVGRPASSIAVVAVMLLTAHADTVGQAQSEAVAATILAAVATHSRVQGTEKAKSGVCAAELAANTIRSTDNC